MQEKFLKTLARCRVVTKSAMEDDLHIPFSVAEKCLVEKLIAEKTQKRGFVEERYYELTDKGEQYIKQNYPEIKEMYRGFVLEQDIALMEFYSKLQPNEQESWITKDEFIVKHKASGTVDGAYVDQNGTLIGVKALSVKADFSSVEKVEKFLQLANIPQIHYIIYQPSKN